jgi:hypothetical protein
MLRIAYIIISSNWTLENKQGETHLLLKGLVTGKRNIRLKIIWGLTIVHIIKFGENVKLYKTINIPIN